MNKKQFFINKKNINLIVYDFDGVMTDNKVLVSENGKESVFCNRSDGLGVSIIKNEGIPQIIISTESNKVMEMRANKLGIPIVYNVSNKKKVLIKYCKKNNYDLKKVVYLGNDVNDIEAMRIVGYPLVPIDAEEEIKKIAKFVIEKRGGDGVIRNFVRYLKF